jgi:hypothetical protein
MRAGARAPRVLFYLAFSLVMPIALIAYFS